MASKICSWPMARSITTAWTCVRSRSRVQRPFSEMRCRPDPLRKLATLPANPRGPLARRERGACRQLRAQDRKTRAPKGLDSVALDSDAARKSLPHGNDR